MLYDAIAQSVQAVEWDGQEFSEQPEWFPKVVGMVTFAVSHDQVITIRAPYAWIGNGVQSTRINPGDEIILENGKLRVLSGALFRELFKPSTGPRSTSLRASA